MRSSVLCRPLIPQDRGLCKILLAEFVEFKFYALGRREARGRAGALNAVPNLIPPYSARTVSDSGHLTEDERLHRHFLPNCLPANE